MLPEAVKNPLSEQLAVVRKLHIDDLKAGIRCDLLTLRAGKKIQECGQGFCLAVRIPGRQILSRPAHRRSPAASHFRTERAASGKNRAAHNRN